MQATKYNRMQSEKISFITFDILEYIYTVDFYVLQDVLTKVFQSICYNMIVLFLLL